MKLVSNVKKKQRRIMRDTKPPNKGMGSSGSEHYWANKIEGNIDVLCNYLNFLIFISVFHSLCLFLALFLLLKPAAFFFLTAPQRSERKYKQRLLWFCKLILRAYLRHKQIIGLKALLCNVWKGKSGHDEEPETLDTSEPDNYCKMIWV